MITKVAFIAHPTRDMAASRAFYGEVLGLTPGSAQHDQWCEYDTPEGKTIALDTFSPVEDGPYLALETDDIEAEVSRLRELGVPIVQDVTDNVVCRQAIVRDPAGHAVMLHQKAPRA